MRILLDNCTPHVLRRLLPGHEVVTAWYLGLANLKNGDLLRAAEGDFELLITADTNMRHQQNLSRTRLRVLLVPQDVAWLRAHRDEVLNAVNGMLPGEYRELARTPA